MKKVILTVMAIFVAVMFASVAVAATSTECNTCAKPACNTCAKPCNTCAKPCAKPACNTCPKPCNTCATPCMPLPKVCVDWKWPKVTVEKCAPCAAPCVQKCVTYKRDSLGQKVPVQTVAAGNANTDSATNYENTLVSGQ